MIPSQEANEEVEKTEVKEDVESKEAEDQPVVDGASGSSWWGIPTGGYSSWMNKAVSSVTVATELAKQKSTEVYGLVAKDLEEVSSQATTMVKSSSMTLKKTFEKIDEKSDEIADQAFESVKSSVSSAWRYAAGYATQMFTEEDLEAEALLVQGSNQEPVMMNRLQAQLYALATDPETFISDPDPADQEEFKKWTCDLDKRQGEISDLMVNNVNIRRNYSSLVPEKTTHKDFWTRYFFKVHLIELQEKKRQELKKRAAEIQEDNAEINWDDVADLASENTKPGKEIPDEVQDKLLKDYERELIEEKVKKAEKGMKKGLNLKQQTPDKEENSSDDWEKLSGGEKSPRKQSREEDEEWVQP